MATALGTVLVGLSVASRPVLADCSPTPTSGNDTILCEAPTDPTSNLDALAGDDTVTIDSGALNQVSGGTGSNTVIVNGGVISTVTGGTGSAGDNSVTVNGGLVGQVFGGTNTTGHNTVTVNGGSVQKVSGGSTESTISITGGTITGLPGNDTGVIGGPGFDIINLTGGEIGTADRPLTVNGGEGGEEITVDGTIIYGTVRSDFAGSSSTDNSTTVLRSGKILKSDGFIGSYGNDDVTVGSGNPAVTMELEGGVNTGTGNDIVRLQAGASLKWVDARQGRDTVILDGADIATFLLAGRGADTLRLLSGTVGANVGGDGGWNEPGVPDTEEGDDQILLAGANITGSIFGNGGNDTIDVASGSARTISGDAGNDTILIHGGLLTGAGGVSGGAGDDVISWTAGVLSTIRGNDGSDTVFVSAAAYDGSQLLDGGDDTSPADGFIDKLTLGQVSVTTTGGKITNWETVTLQGGSLTLSDGTLAVSNAADAEAGLFLKSGAGLSAGAPLNLTGNLSIGAGSVFQQLVAGAGMIDGYLVNSGAVNLRNGSAGDVLAVTGNYTGGGQLLVDVAGDTADLMTVGGDVLGNPTRISAQGIAQGNTGIPIAVVEVTGSTHDGDFTSPGFDLGLYSYSLQRDGQVWQFVADDITDGGALYPGVGHMVDLFNRETIATHFERTGSWARARAAGEDVKPDDGVTTLAGGDSASDGKVWLRAIGQWSEGDAELKGAAAGLGNQNISYDRDVGGVQGGVDVIVAQTGSHLVTAGVFGQTGRMTGDVQNKTSGTAAGSLQADAWGLGASLGFDTESFYVEAVGGWNSYDISADTGAGSSSTNGTGYFVSFEAGHEFALSHGVTLIPQAQFVWVGTTVDSFTDAGGTDVSFDNGATPIGRIGLALDADAGNFSDQPLRLTGILNYWQDFGDPAQTSVDGISLEMTQAGGSIEAGAGFHWGTEEAPMHLHGQLTYRNGLGGDGEQSWNGTMGLRIAF